MIDRKFLFFKNRKTFEDALKQGEINRRESIVFIKGETLQDRAIWTHGVYYEPSTGLEHSKGFFESYQALYNTYSWPAVGDWAIVANEPTAWIFGDRFPITFYGVQDATWVIYTCEQAGVWKKTGRLYDKEGIDLTEYLKRDELDLTPFITRDEIHLENYLTKSEAEDVYAAQNDVAYMLSLKQNDLISGTTIKTINGQSLLGSGDIPIVQTVTINNEEVVDLTQIEQDIQDIKDSIVELNDSVEDQEYIYIVLLTQEQYDALEEYNENALYFIIEIPAWHFGEEIPAYFNKTT